MKARFLPLIVLLPAMLLAWTPHGHGDTIVNSKHNLSVSGPGNVKAVAETRICVFCHTVKGASGTATSYLWNRSTPAQAYIPYDSSTLYALVGQPTGASKLCLSCHDGTIALGALGSEAGEVLFGGGLRFMPYGPTRLGTDLSDDHPVSFVYDGQLALLNPELKDPLLLPAGVRLDGAGRLQCTACHDPHDNINGMFLVMPNTYSALCTSCHQRAGWASSAHATSGAVWNGAGSDPWPHTDYLDVAENGCENCHRSHSAPGGERLLNHAFEEDNCLVCHNGNVARVDIEVQVSKPYGHHVQDYAGAHDAAEDFSLHPGKHVECVDCHNGHQANDDAASGAPRVSGANRGASGINAGNQAVASVQFGYEICLKCHGDNNVISAQPFSRQINQLNTRMEFDPSNPSFHPVESGGQNDNVPSLLPPLTTASMIYCTDCHNSDQPSVYKGPHGSVYGHILEKNYETDDFTAENANAYALCYKCHGRNSILGDESFSQHRRHIVTANAPCAVCHDPHGISATQGSAGNHSHLINFDLSVVQAEGSRQELIFQDSGPLTGSCTLRCHGRDHVVQTYP